MVSLLTAAMGLTAAAFTVYVVLEEQRRLENAAQRLRELELEGLEEVSVRDTIPEFAQNPGTIRLADGTETDRDALLRRELAVLRRYERDREAPDDAAAC